MEAAFVLERRKSGSRREKKRSKGAGRSVGVFAIASSYLWTLVQVEEPLMCLETLWCGQRAKGGVKAEPDRVTM